MKKTIYLTMTLSVFLSLLVAGCNGPAGGPGGSAAYYDPNPDHVPYVPDFQLEQPTS